MKTKIIYVSFFFTLFSMGCGGGNTLLVVREAFSTPQSSLAKNTWKLNIQTVAILPFQRSDDELEPDYSQIEKNAENILYRETEKAVIKILPYKVISRNEVNRILAEQDFQQRDIFDENKRKKIGKLLSADAVFFGRVERYAIEAKKMGTDETVVQFGEIKFSLKLVEIETGQIIWAGSHRATTKRMLSESKVEFEVDEVQDKIKENAKGDREVLLNLDKLSQGLVRELLGAFKKSLSEKKKKKKS